MAVSNDVQHDSTNKVCAPPRSDRPMGWNDLSVDIPQEWLAAPRAVLEHPWSMPANYGTGPGWYDAL